MELPLPEEVEQLQVVEVALQPEAVEVASPLLSAPYSMLPLLLYDAALPAATAPLSGEIQP